MVVTTRQAQDCKAKPPSDPQAKPSSQAVIQTKANDRQLQYLLAAYESLARSGQVAIASKATGLCV